MDKLPTFTIAMNDGSLIYGELYPDAGTVVWDYVGPTKAAVTLSVPLYGKEGRR